MVKILDRNGNLLKEINAETLRGANLSEANLSGANLSGANVGSLDCIYNKRTYPHRL